MYNKFVYGCGCAALLLNLLCGCSATVPDGDEPSGDLVKIDRQNGPVSRKNACNIVATDLTAVLLKQSQTRFSIGLAADDDGGLGRKTLKELAGAVDFQRDSVRVSTFRLESRCQELSGDFTEWSVRLIRRSDGREMYALRLKLQGEDI